MTDEPTPRTADDRARAKDLEPHVRVVRLGHGANCSSIGSVIDTLFVGAVLGGVVLAAIAAAMGGEEIKVHGGKGASADPKDEGGDAEDNATASKPSPASKDEEGDA